MQLTHVPTIRVPLSWPLRYIKQLLHLADSTFLSSPNSTFAFFHFHSRTQSFPFRRFNSITIRSRLDPGQHSLKDPCPDRISAVQCCTASMTSSTDQILSRILDELTELKVKNSHLEAKVDSLQNAATLPSPSSHARRQSSSGFTALGAHSFSPSQPADFSFGTSPPPQPLGPPAHPLGGLPQTAGPSPAETPDLGTKKLPVNGSASPSIPAATSSTAGYYSSRVILTTYPARSASNPYRSTGPLKILSSVDL